MGDRRFLTVLSFLVVIWTLPMVAVAACGSTDVCIDVVGSLTGQINIETATIQIDWSTNSEDSSIDRYVLKRYNCSQPETCTTTVATIYATGECSETESYTYTDSPAAPQTSWYYAVEVWRANVKACTVDNDPV